MNEQGRNVFGGVPGLATHIDRAVFDIKRIERVVERDAMRFVLGRPEEPVKHPLRSEQIVTFDTWPTGSGVLVAEVGEGYIEVWRMVLAVMGPTRDSIEAHPPLRVIRLAGTMYEPLNELRILAH